MGQALYRAHRPKKLAEVVGQEHITTALTRALANGTISHAYLFTGPRGVGKTTIARILAHEVNGLPYDDESMHLDIIEIDAASNRRIDEIRDLRDKVHIAPSAAKYKVYIIDEVHMLTKEAFNALLKTLEEPPAHVVFILATTEAHKLPETIISRTQRFAFKPVDLAKVVAHLRSIADAEKITIDDEALQLIAAHGEGSFRDSISLLDQVRNSGEKVSLADVQATLGIAPAKLIEELLSALAAQDAAAVAQALRAVHTGGHEPSQVARQLGEALRQQILSGKPQLSSDIILQLLTKLLEVPSSADPKSYLEIALLDAALSGAPQAAQPSQASPAPKVMKEAVAVAPALTEPHPSAFRKSALKPREEEEEESDQPASSATLDKSIWPQVLAAVKAKHNTLYSIFRAAEPTFNKPGTIELICAFAFHQKRLNEKRNKQVLGDIIRDVSGENVRLIFTVGTPNVPQFDDLPPALPPADEQVFSVGGPAAGGDRERLQTGAPGPQGRSEASLKKQGRQDPQAQEGLAGQTALNPEKETRQDPQAQAAPASQGGAKPATGTLETITNIFGGAELLES